MTPTKSRAELLCIHGSSAVVYILHLSRLERKHVSRGILFVHGLSSSALSDHVSEDSQHSGTSVVHLNIELADLLLGALDVISEPANTVVSVVLGSRHPGELDKSEEEKDLQKSGGGDGTDSINTGGDVGELEVLRLGEVSIEDDVVVVDNVSNNGGHANTSVLALDGTTTLEGLGLVVEPSKRIENTERGGDTNLKLVDHVEGGGGLAGLSRGEGRNSGEEKGGDGKLHGEIGYFDKV